MKINSKIRKTLLGLVAVAGFGLIGGASAFAYGPADRATFTMKNPATYPVFNSITDNPTIGDERDFVRVGEIHSDVTSMSNEVEVIPGKQYLVYIYFHNNASATYNDAAHNNSGVATGVRVSTLFPTVLKSGEKGKVAATITANNTNPLSVWDEAYFTTSRGKVLLSYVAGSAKIYNDYKANGSIMPSSMFTEGGALVGLNALNGVIPGCEQYHGVITYVVEAKELKGTLGKTVSKDGKNFKENAEIKVGEEATFKLTIKNAGDIELKNAVIKDTLPAGMSLVPGSVQLWANNSSTKDTISDDIVKNGVNLGTIGTGNTVYITYRVKASEEYKCKGINLVNTAKLTYDSDQTTGDSTTDTAKVTVLRENCEEERKKPGFEIDKQISLDGENWADNIDAKPGDTAKFRIIFKNTGEVIKKSVVAKDVLNKDAGLEFVPGSVKITRSVNGAITQSDGTDDLFGNGLNIGDSNPGETITITYDVKFVADKFECGTTTLYNNASISGKVGDSADITTVNDSVEIKVTRTEGCDEPKTDCEDHPDAPECNLPKTGPVEIVMAIVIALGIGGGGYYFYRTKKSLKTIEGAATGKDANTPKA